MMHVRNVAAAVLLLACGPLLAEKAWAGEFIVRAVTIDEMKAVYGQVESRTIVPARTRISGTITEVRVSEGQEIAQGELIARVVDEKIALQLRAADAKVAALNSQVENARTELQRAEDLMSKGAAAQSRVDAARLQLDVAANQLAAAAAEKAVLEQSAKEGDTLAPANGRVLSVPVTAGSVVLAGETVARVASGHYYLRLSLPERHAAEIVAGGKVVIEARGADASSNTSTTREGLVVKVYPEIDNGRVIADVEVADIGDYFVNERTLVSIPVAKRTLLGVPQEAIRTVHGVDYVTIASTDGTLDVAVVAGEPYEHDGQTRIEVLTGLADGDRVVLP